MENSERQTQILNLGKLLVSELDHNSDADTFSKWMAHYIAEKMNLIEQLPAGEDKKDAEQECFETILKLWGHRWQLPSGKRPLEKFEPILKTLKRLSPEEQDPFFQRSLDYELSELKKDNPDIVEITNYTSMALQIDKVARIWIEFMLHQATLKSKTEKTETLLKNTSSLHNDDDVTIVRMILDNNPSVDSKNYNQEDFPRKYQLEKLKRRVEELEKFSKINEFLLAYFKKEIEAIS